MKKTKPSQGSFEAWLKAMIRLNREDSQNDEAQYINLAYKHCLKMYIHYKSRSLKHKTARRK